MTGLLEQVQMDHTAVDVIVVDERHRLPNGRPYRADEALTGTNRARPGLREALAAYRAGDQWVMTKLDRFERSVCGAHDIARN